MKPICHKINVELTPSLSVLFAVLINNRLSLEIWTRLSKQHLFWCGDKGSHIILIRRFLSPHHLFAR